MTRTRKMRNLLFLGSVTFSGIAMVLLFIGLAASSAATGVQNQVWIDEFDNLTLSSRWSWINEDPTHWSLTARPGFLRITTQDTWPPNNILVQDIPVGDFEIQTRVLFTPTQFSQQAGMVVYEDDSNWIGLNHLYFFTGEEVHFLRVVEGAIVENIRYTSTLDTDMHFRVVRHSTVYTGYVSLDGTNWVLLGALAGDSIQPSKIGLWVRHFSTTEEASADFDFFKVIDNSFHLFLPVTVRDE